MRKSKKEIKSKSLIKNKILDQSQSINWTTTILKIALLPPYRGFGQRFWEVGSGLFLSFSASELDDEEGNILRKGWQISDEFRGISRKIDRDTARRIMRGIISDIIMKKK